MLILISKRYFDIESPSSLPSKLVRNIIPKFFFIRDFFFGVPNRKNYQLEMDHLEMVDTTTFFQWESYVLDGVATSHGIVTNYVLFEDLEVRFKYFLDWTLRGHFYIFHNVLSNFFKFVSLSLVLFWSMFWGFSLSVHTKKKYKNKIHLLIINAEGNQTFRLLLMFAFTFHSYILFEM